MAHCQEKRHHLSNATYSNDICPKGQAPANSIPSTGLTDVVRRRRHLPTSLRLCNREHVAQTERSRTHVALHEELRYTGVSHNKFCTKGDGVRMEPRIGWFLGGPNVRGLDAISAASS